MDMVITDCKWLKVEVEHATRLPDIATSILLLEVSLCIRTMGMDFFLHGKPVEVTANSIIVSIRIFNYYRAAI